MAKGNTGGGAGRGLNLKARLDISEAVRSAQALKKELASLGVSTSGSGKAFDVKPMTAFQQGVLKLKDQLNEKNKIWKDLIITEQRAKAISAEAKAETDILKIAEQELTNALRQGKITRDEYILSQKRLTDAQKLAAATQREADRQVNQANRLQREQLQLQRQQEVQRERNRRKLQQESSEYYKLNQALNNVRNKSKDLLAEMFKLELQGKKNTDAYRALEARSKSLVTQTQILDRGIKGIDATLGLHQRHVGDYGRALEGLSPRFAMINGQLAAFGTSITALAETGGMAAFGASIAAVGKSILKFLISPVGIAVTAVAALYALFSSNKDTVINFDDRLLNVGKTTNLLGRNLIELGNEVINLSRKLKTVSSEKLLEYATVAGQLGVKGKDDILAFSEALAKLEIATNINGEQGGAEIARLLTLTDGGVQNVKQFGDEIVNLGNNFAATEKEILSNAESISQNTGLYKVGRQEVLAYAVATKAVGLEAEVVGSSFNRTLATFEKSIRTGENISELTKNTGLSVDQLKAKFKENASGVFNDFITGLNKVYINGGSVNEVLENIGITAVRDQRVIATLASNGYDVLTRSLDTVRNASGSLNKEFDTASGKLKNQSAKFGIAWDNLVLSVENGQGIIGKSATSIIGAFTDIVDGLTPSTRSMIVNEEQVNKLAGRYDELTTKGKLLGGEFKLTKDEQEELRKVTAEIGNILPGVITEFDKYGNALDINRSKIDQMTKAQRELLAVQNKDDIGKAQRDFDNATEIQNAYQKRVLKGASFFITESNIADFKDKATLMSGEAYKAAKAIRDLGGTLNKSQKDIIAYYESIDAQTIKSGINTNKPIDETGQAIERTTAFIKNQIAELKKLRKPLDIASAGYKDYTMKIKALQKELKLANGGGITTRSGSENSGVSARNSLQREIDDAIKSSRRKQMSADDSEVQAVEDKYSTIREKVKQHYDKLGKMDPKKKAELNVRISGLDDAELFEKQAVIDNKSNDRFKSILSIQAKDFEDFENYKTKFGIEAAEKRYGKEFTIGKTYSQKLEDFQTKLLSEITDPAEATESQKQTLAAVTDAIKQDSEKRKAMADADYASARQDAMTNAEKFLQIERDYQKNLLALTQKGDDTPERVAILDKARKKSISALAVDDLTDTDAWKNLFSDMDTLTISQIDTLIKEIEAKFDNLKVKFDPIDLAEIRKKLQEARQVVIEKNPFASLGSAIKAVFSDGADGAKKSAKQIQIDWKNLGAAMEGSFAFVDNAIQSTDILKEAIGEVGATAISSLAATASVAIAVTAAIKTAEKASVVLAIISAALVVVQAISGLFKSIFNAHDKRVEKSIEKHKDQVESLGGAYNRLERDVNNAVGKAVEQAHLSQIENLKQQQVELEKIREAEKSKKKPDQGKINETNDQIASIGDKIQDVQKAMVEALTGTTAKSISDGIISGFKSGKRAAKDFADDFNGLMEDALLKALQTNFLDVEMAKFYKQFAEAAKDGITDEEAAKLRTNYTGIINEGLELVKDIDKITGGPKKKDEDSETGTLRASLTEETGSKLEGLWRGQYDMTRQLVIQSTERNALLIPVSKGIGELYSIAKANFDVALRIEANTLRTADNTERLREIELGIKTIATNTKPSTTPRALGI